MTRLGYAAISLAAVLWAVGGTTASYLASRGASVVELTQARAWIAVVGIGLIVSARRRRAQPRERVSALVIPFGLAVAAANFTYYTSVALLPVAVAITIQYTAPGLVVCWAAVVQKRALSARTYAALAFALAGVAALSEVHLTLGAEGLRLDGLGLVMSVAAAFAFATYIVIGERIGRSMGSERAVFWGFAVASVFWLAVQAFRGRPDTLLDPRFTAWVLFLGVASTIVPFLLFVWGLERVDASRAGVISTLEPLTAALIAFLWLGQSLTSVQLVGAAMVVGGIAVVQTEKAPLAERAAVE